MVKDNDNFASIYDGMDAVYAKVEDLMGRVYVRIKNDPKDEDAKNLLVELNEIAQSLLYIQMEIVKSYCDKELVGRLVSAINDKVNSLNGLDQLKSKSM